MEWKRSSLLSIAIGAMVCQSALAQTVNARFPREPSEQENVFTRMFPDLPPFSAQSSEMRNAASGLGRKDGLLDAKDILTDPIQSILDPAKFSPNNPDNEKMTAGMTFLGQFLDHDITLDLRSALTQRADPGRTVNFRTAAFDLDSVYGEGPQRSPELYEQGTTPAPHIRLRVDPIPGSEKVSRGGALRYDLPRESDGEAIVGDSRNDENVVISQFHVAMLRFHNAVTEYLLKESGNQALTQQQLFDRARRLVTWHYQWCILHEFLPLTIGQERLDRILRFGNRFYDAGSVRRTPRGRPLIPIEFSVAAYRFGHSQIRPSYRINFGPTGGSPVFVFILDDSLNPNSRDPNDMRGGMRAARRFIDWQTFFDFHDGNVRPNKRIDTHISSPMMLMPGTKAPAPGLPADGVQSLPSRNLMRHVNFGLPSGQAVARRIGVPVLTAQQLADVASYRMSESTPLWYYILKEAEVMEDGLRLGPVGGRIVGEVFVGLLKADRSSYLSVNPQWKPNLPTTGRAGTFTITDLLRFAGVVPPLQ